MSQKAVCANQHLQDSTCVISVRYNSLPFKSRHKLRRVMQTVLNLKKKINYDQLGLVMWGAALQLVYIHFHRFPEGET